MWVIPVNIFALFSYHLNPCPMHSARSFHHQPATTRI
jgi:hypothetical protein